MLLYYFFKNIDINNIDIFKLRIVKKLFYFLPPPKNVPCGPT